MTDQERLAEALARVKHELACAPAPGCMERVYLEGWAEAVGPMRGCCLHQELYEQRSDGASDIYPDIMHDGKCSDETTCDPCGNCKAIAKFCDAMLGGSDG